MTRPLFGNEDKTGIALIAAFFVAHYNGDNFSIEKTYPNFPPDNVNINRVVKRASGGHKPTFDEFAKRLGAVLNADSRCRSKYAIDRPSDSMRIALGLEQHTRLIAIYPFASMVSNPGASIEAWTEQWRVTRLLSLYDNLIKIELGFSANQAAWASRNRSTR